MAYSENQKTEEYEDDIKALLKCICFYKEKSFTDSLRIHFQREIPVVCAHCTIAVFHVYWILKNYNLNPKSSSVPAVFFLFLQYF